MTSLNGTWRDSAGNSGSFIFTPGAGIGGAPRPVPAGGVAPASITSAEIAPNAVGSSQIAPGAVGSTQMAGNAITGAHVADGSLTIADLANAPRAAFASGDQQLSLGLPQVVRTVTLTAPSAGHIIANATGFLGSAMLTSVRLVCATSQGASERTSHI
jgi:hypothetical protein